jgi:hypothetical protein
MGNFSEKEKKQPTKKSNLEILENFRDAKNSLYLNVGNMYDINNMSMTDFNNLNEYLERSNKMKSGQPVKLRESNKRMIEARKLKEKKQRKK